MFKRRTKPRLMFRLRQLIWPEMPWRRILRYFNLRIIRLSHMPEPLARAIASGITVCFFPVFGVHTLMGMALAFILRANVLAAAVAANVVIPPVLLPLILSLDFLVGRKILRYFGFDTQGTETGFVREATAGTDYVSNNFNDLFLPALLGSVIFMLLVWPATYMAAHKLIEVLARRHKIHKQLKLQKKLAKHL